MSEILPGHENLRMCQVVDGTGKPLFVTTGNGVFHPLMMCPTGMLKAGMPSLTREEMQDVNSSDTSTHRPRRRVWAL